MGTYLIKPGELTLKGKNRDEFELRLRKNLQQRLKGNSCTISLRRGRFYLSAPDSAREKVEQALSHTPGIAGWALAHACEKDMDIISALATKLAKEAMEEGARSFKVESRRADKTFPLQSTELSRQTGSAILEALPSLSVDVHTPDVTINIEVREQVWLYGASTRGVRGLPTGSSGRGLLMLSGGIDSPVAGYLMATRGMRIDAIYFHAWPYTSNEAKEKVVDLARILARWDPAIRLSVIPFTDVQLHIKERAPQAWTTLMMRMAMVEISSRLGFRDRAQALITGESLGQVASQTVENIGCSDSQSRLPVLRPLIGMDKEDIIQIAKQIGSYETSILPYEDCCVLFSPKHPIIHAPFKEAQEIYAGLELKELLYAAFQGRERIKL